MGGLGGNKKGGDVIDCFPQITNFRYLQYLQNVCQGGVLERGLEKSVQKLICIIMGDLSQCRLPH